MNKKQQEFLKKHDIRIVDDNKRWARVRPVRYEFFKDVTDFNRVATVPMQYDTERLLTVEIPESRLDAIQSFEEQVFNNMQHYGAQHYMMFEVMMAQKEKEQFLRNKHPAVKKAYEHYSLMLKLADDGEFDA